MKSDSGKFYIGIDSGGTKCELLIVSSAKKILFGKNYAGVHYSVSGAEVYSKTVSEFIKAALASRKLNLKDCLGICIGVAGAREAKDREKLTLLFVRKLKFKKILITTDAMTALYGAFEGNEGIILISGTGSVLYGYLNGKIIRTGGWGRIIGDEGSGYWVGRRALNLIAKEYDKRKQTASPLSVMLAKKSGINKLNINSITFHKDFEIQKLAPLVIQCAEKMKCSLSRQIIDEAVEGLIEQIKTNLKVSKRKKPIEIAFIGSVIENKNLLSDKLKSEIRKLKIVKVVLKKHSSAFGAFLLASGNSDIIKKL